MRDERDSEVMMSFKVGPTQNLGRTAERKELHLELRGGEVLRRVLHFRMLNVPPELAPTAHVALRHGSIRAVYLQRGACKIR